jgi:HPt (histidine-containing phosphotransfer) domain-containing protein
MPLFAPAPVFEFTTPEQAIELIGLFIGEMSLRVGAIGEALRGTLDLLAVRAGAHALKGSAASVGASRVAALCDHMCEAAQAADLTSLSLLHLQLLDAAARTAALMGERRDALTVAVDRQEQALAA